MSELLATGSIDSLLNKLIMQEEKVDLHDYDIPSCVIPQQYNKHTIAVRETEGSADTGHLDAQLEEVYAILEKNNFPKYTTASIGEAVVNAFVHGNKRDSSKKINLYVAENEQNVSILIEDEGGVFDSAFVAYILHNRTGNQEHTNYYQFSRKKKPAERGGSGTMIMHEYADEVNYHKAPSGGLLVELTFDKK